MGFYVSTLGNLPVGGIDNFVYVVDNSGGEHTRWISDELYKLAAPFGPKAGLVAGPPSLSAEITDFVHKYLKGDQFHAASQILVSMSCLLISKGHLTKTNQPIYLMPIAAHTDAMDEQFVREMLLKIADAIAQGSLDKLVQNLGAYPFALKENPGGFWVCTLRHLNEILDFKPNIIGIGINLNALVEKALPPKQRVL